MPAQQAKDFTTKDFMKDKMGPYDEVPQTSINQGTTEAQSQNPEMTKIERERSQLEQGLVGVGMPAQQAKDFTTKDFMKDKMGPYDTAPTSAVNGMANQVAAREFTPNINKPLGIGQKGALTSGEADKYLGANMSEQDSLRQKAADLSVKAAKGDKGSQAQLQETKEKLSGLSERYKSAEGTKSTLAYGERPVEAGAESMAKKLGRSRAEMQSSGVNEQQRMKEAADRALGPQENKGNQTSTSKGEVNVSFTPISIDLKGSIETANDELNEKMTDAIKQAVEQLAPGIISKIYGPPRDKAKS
jgi:hypothetical protein